MMTLTIESDDSFILFACKNSRRGRVRDLIMNTMVAGTFIIPIWLLLLL